MKQSIVEFFKKCRLTISIVLAGFCVLAVSCDNNSKNMGAELESNFMTPPDDAKPRVWWHWMNGNVTKDGIRKDLEWMNRSGIGGFQNFNVGMTNQVVEKRLIPFDPEWQDAVEFTAKLADSLGLEMAEAASPGWSESGGPWVTPKEAMKKYVWSETRIEGGKAFSGLLPHPPTATGSFQNVKSAGRGFSYDPDEIRPEYYADAAVVAYRVPESDLSMAELQPKVTSSGGNFTLEALTDGDVFTTTLLPEAPVGEKAWVQYEFDEPQTIQSATFAASGGGGGFGFGRGSSGNRTLEVSNDGKDFTQVAEIENGSVSQTTINFTPVTGKYFRFNFRTPEPPPANQQNNRRMFRRFGNQNTGPAGTQIAELVLNTGAYVNNFEDKAGFSTTSGADFVSSPTPEMKNAIPKSDVVDLTSMMDAEGNLQWDVPQGRWDIIRIGYTLTGQRNKPASPELTGLEVDKYNPDYVRNYFNYYLDKFEEATGGLMGQHGLQYLISDSWEAASANWTDNMITEFKNRRGYDMIPWLPVLAGHVVESGKASDRFLWDLVRTLEEMVAEYHYDQMTDILEERGMKGRYSEAHEGGRPMIGDGMEVKRTAAVPMSAMWTPGGFAGIGNTISDGSKADIRESASVSHIYGQKYVAAESMTASRNPWAWSPALLKPTADMELASGLNRFVIHTSVHQPLDNAPGFSLGPFGQWFTRLETWSDQAIAWTTYLARNSYMLQQGEVVADVAYLYGELYNITAISRELPPIPEGYEFDFVNADALINVLQVQNGNITSPAGASYRILAMDPSTSRMTVPVLKKIKSMVESGMVVCGAKPVETPSNSDDPIEFEALVNELWPIESGVNTIGKGKVYIGYTIAQALENENIAPDFTYTKPEEDTELLYVHRNVDGIDFYWINSRNDRFQDVEATFRVEGREAEIWHPENGMIEDASYSIDDDKTTVPLHLSLNDAVFVVFRNKAAGMSRTIEPPEEEVLTTVQGPWEVNFVSKVGMPYESVFESLSPWNENVDEIIKYFSGTGTYVKTIDVPADWLSEDQRVCLDLGDVQNLAEVSVNGKSLGVVWKKPFRIDVTDALTEGENTFEIKVVNAWVNRLIGDEQPGVENKLTFTTNSSYQADSPLKESGLLGPVQLIGLSDN